MAGSSAPDGCHPGAWDHPQKTKSNTAGVDTELHWANLTRDPLVLLDWEGWAPAPAGYDAAVLHAYALPEPDTAAQVREVFAEELDTEAGHLAQLIICAEIVQAAPRDDLHARLAPYASAHVHHLLSSWWKPSGVGRVGTALGAGVHGGGVLRSAV